MKQEIKAAFDQVKKGLKEKLNKVDIILGAKVLMNMLKEAFHNYRPNIKEHLAKLGENFVIRPVEFPGEPEKTEAQGDAEEDAEWVQYDQDLAEAERNTEAPTDADSRTGNRDIDSMSDR